MDIEPRRGDADLAVVAELADDGRLGDLLHVGVGEDDQGRVAAELQAQPLDLVGRAADQLLADRRVEPVKLILRTAGCVEEGVGELDRVGR